MMVKIVCCIGLYLLSLKDLRRPLCYLSKMQITNAHPKWYYSKYFLTKGFIETYNKKRKKKMAIFNFAKMALLKPCMTFIFLAKSILFKHY